MACIRSTSHACCSHPINFTCMMQQLHLPDTHNNPAAACSHAATPESILFTPKAQARCEFHSTAGEIWVHQHCWHAAYWLPAGHLVFATEGPFGTRGWLCTAPCLIMDYPLNSQLQQVTSATGCQLLLHVCHKSRILSIYVSQDIVCCRQVCVVELQLDSGVAPRDHVTSRDKQPREAAPSDGCFDKHMAIGQA